MRDLPAVPREEVLRRLADGADGVTVVTPNQRLSAALIRDFDARQAGRGIASWESPDILPLAAFVERLYEDALYSELAERLPVLLTPVQEQVLWESVIGDSQTGKGLLSPSASAALARDAWQLAHAWRLLARLRGFPANDDAKAFAEWAWRYEGVTERDRVTDRARLADVVAPHLAQGSLRKPRTLIVFGFDILAPQLRDLLDALAATGVELRTARQDERPGAVRRVAFASAKEELLAAARWARARLDAASASGAGVLRVGVVVPDLERSRETVRRVFTQAMEPARLLGPAGSAAAFNISLGAPLASQPLAAAALLVLELGASMIGRKIEFERASRLLRSPFLAGALSELDRRARLDAALRETASAKTGLESLRRAIARATAGDNPFAVAACPILLRRLGDLASFATANLPGSRRASEWARIALSLLDVVGFPGERELDSAEYQTLEKLREVATAFAALDRVAKRMRFGEAIDRLADMVAGTLFQPEVADVPVQVLGVLESAGLEFDHLWIAGLTEEAWPLPARPNPLVPIALQRSAGVPESSPATALELDARITRGWLSAAGEVVVSHPLHEEDRDLVPSALVRDLPETDIAGLGVPEHTGIAETIRRAGRIERLPEFRAPPPGAQGTPGPVPVSGGTGVFRDQALCPFRAFAAHRLRADPLSTPPAALDASDRGSLLHALLARLWTELKSKAFLDTASERDLDAALAAAADHAIRRQRRYRPDALEGRFAQLERERLIRLGRSWLDAEKKRPPFEVLAVEQKRAIGFGGIVVNARLDRMDRLAGEPGAHAILDYKTGAANVTAWLGPRPDEPQLPLYALGAEEPISAVAFACVRAGAMEFKGVGAKEGLIPGVKPITAQRSPAARGYSGWDDLLAGWRRELDLLGSEFAAGEASVRPKNGDETCRFCGRQTLCRIDEREGT